MNYSTRRRITERMTMREAINYLSQGNWETATLLSKLLDSEPLQRAQNILALDELGIYGRQLHRFLTVCCKGNFQLVNKTLFAYRDGALFESEIFRAIRKGQQIELD